MENAIAKTATLAAMRTFLNGFGMLGQAMIESIEFHDNVRRERLQNLMEYLVQSESNGRLSIESISNENFVELFYLIAESTMRSSSEKRRERLRNILHNALVQETLEEQEARRFVRILDRITDLQIKILDAFARDDKERRYSLNQQLRDAKKEVESARSKLKREKKSVQDGYAGKPISVEKILNTAERNFDDLNAALAEFPNPSDEATHGIDRMHFLTELTELLGTGVLHDNQALGLAMDSNRSFQISDMGKRFIKYISDPD